VSRELYAYAQSDHPVLRSDLDEAFSALGWDYLLFEDLSSFRQGPNETHVRSCDLLVWDDDDDVAATVRRAVAARDEGALDKLYQETSVGSVFVDLEFPFDADPEMLEEARAGEVDTAIVNRIAASNLCYAVRTPAGRNDFSLEVQTAVANLLAVALYGVLEDPQEGIFEDLSREIIEDDPSDSPPPANRPWWKFWS
jgi:hypothetical protein